MQGQHPEDFPVDSKVGNRIGTLGRLGGDAGAGTGGGQQRDRAVFAGFWIEKDAELGVAKGQLEELAGHSARLTVLLHRVNLVKLPGLLARRLSQRLSGKG